MSFGDPNNPYGPPQGQQPGYGQPQGQQPGYGYPAAPPVSPYGAYPGGPAPYGAPMPMPGTVKAARVMLWIMGILQILVGIIAAFAGSMLVNEAGLDSTASATATGVIVIIGLIGVALGVWGVIIAAKCANGGNGIRISGIVYGSLVTAGGLANMAQGQGASVVALVLGILIIVFFSKADAAAWFKRPRF
ncbi:hypothetical protein ACIQRS_06880 [Streptomyces termitum]|uniref:Uncharacterized protein n=1 Tax=Streptomyces termitum TaxID=67368 RepID=A0A918W547_9ACTN|nr:hypothetical protein [Streptomyces termitum]GHA66702.1 hypothetical protein GCM10010305_05830 [Streptomyces termitum]